MLRYQLTRPTPNFTLKPGVSRAGTTSKESLPKIRHNLPWKWTTLPNKTCKHFWKFKSNQKLLESSCSPNHNISQFIFHTLIRKTQTNNHRFRVTLLKEKRTRNIMSGSYTIDYAFSPCTPDLNYTNLHTGHFFKTNGPRENIWKC